MPLLEMCILVGFRGGFFLYRFLCFALMVVRIIRYHLLILKPHPGTHKPEASRTQTPVEMMTMKMYVTHIIPPLFKLVNREGSGSTKTFFMSLFFFFFSQQALEQGFPHGLGFHGGSKRPPKKIFFVLPAKNREVERRLGIHSTAVMLK